MALRLPDDDLLLLFDVEEVDDVDVVVVVFVVDVSAEQLDVLSMELGPWLLGLGDASA